MYGIFAYIYHKNQPNVGKYTIYGSCGYMSSFCVGNPCCFDPLLQVLPGEQAQRGAEADVFFCRKGGGGMENHGRYQKLDLMISNVYTWNPNDPCFEWKGPSFGGLTFKNRGQLGSRYIYIYVYYIPGTLRNQS